MTHEPTHQPQPNLSLPGVTHSTMSVGAVTLHYASAGTGAPVVLLHGFPEFWYSWRRQLPALAEAGFRAVAPDLRGYNESDRPTGVANYRVAQLVADVAGLIEGLGGGPAFVVGHDWGGIIAWRLATLRPQLVRKLAILNAPHPARYAHELKRNPSQWLRSWYAFVFQLPWLPERILRAHDFAIMRRAWREQPVHPEAFTDEDIAAYKQVFARPGVLTGPINYYRAATRYAHDLNGEPQLVPMPTLLLWGARDPFLSIKLTEGLERWVPDLRVVRFPDSSHWIQNDVPEQVNEQLILFFKE